MKYLIVLLILFITACNNVPVKVEEQKDYTDLTVDSFNKLKSPVVLIAARKSLGSYSIVIKDSTGKFTYFGNMSSFADLMGSSKCIGDTLK